MGAVPLSACTLAAGTIGDGFGGACACPVACPDPCPDADPDAGPDCPDVGGVACTCASGFALATVGFLSLRPIQIPHKTPTASSSPAQALTGIRKLAPGHWSPENPLPKSMGRTLSLVRSTSSERGWLFEVVSPLLSFLKLCRSKIFATVTSLASMMGKSARAVFQRLPPIVALPEQHGNKER